MKSLIILVPNNIELSPKITSFAGITSSILQKLVSYLDQYDIATPQGAPALVQNDSQIQTNINKALELENIDPSKYDVLVIPSMLGLLGYVNSQPFTEIMVPILKQFQDKVIFAIGYGSSVLCSEQFKGYNITGMSIKHLAQLPFFSYLPFIPEDSFIEIGANFVVSESEESIMIVIDRKLITVANDLSAYPALTFLKTFKL